MRRTPPPNYVYRPPNARPIHLSVLGKRKCEEVVSVGLDWLPAVAFVYASSGRWPLGVQVMSLWPFNQSAFGPSCSRAELRPPYHLPKIQRTPAKNMQLCGMPSTQVQRAARRIAAEPLYGMKIPPLIAFQRIERVVLRRGPRTDTSSSCLCPSCWCLQSTEPGPRSRPF